jgi:hypothetical protein
MCAVGLLLFVSVLLDTGASASEREGLLRQIDSALIPDQTTPQSIPESGCEWQDYTCNLSFYWAIPDGYGDDYFNMRFVSYADDTLRTVRIAFYKDYSEFSDVSGNGVDVIVWDDDGFGLPGTELARVNVPSSGMMYLPHYLYVDFSPFNLVFPSMGEFHVGFTTVAQSTDSYAILSDDGTCGALRSSEYWNGMWDTVLNAFGVDVNFHIAVKFCPTSIFRAHFMTPQNDPYPFDLTILRGDWIREFDNVTYVVTDVPEAATYKFVYQWDGKPMGYGVALGIVGGDAKEFDFFALDPDSVFGNAREVPYILFEETGANASLSHSINGDRVDFTVDGTPGKIVAVDIGVVRLGGASEPWIVVDWWPWPPYWPCPPWWPWQWPCPPWWSWWFPIYYDFWIWDELPFNGFVEFDQPDLDEIAIVWEPIDWGYPYDVFLTTSDLRTVTSDETLPQLHWGGRRTGDKLSVVSSVPDLAQLHLPVQPFAGSVLNVSFKPVLTARMEVGTFNAVAAHSLAEPSYSNLYAGAGDSISVDLATDLNQDWWGCFVLPGIQSVGELLAYSDTRGVDSLRYWDDYLEYKVADYNLVTVRVRPEFTRLNLVCGTKKVYTAAKITGATWIDDTRFYTVADEQHKWTVEQDSSDAIGWILKGDLFPPHQPPPVEVISSQMPEFVNTDPDQSRVLTSNQDRACLKYDLSAQGSVNDEISVRAGEPRIFDHSFTGSLASAPAGMQLPFGKEGMSIIYTSQVETGPGGLLGKIVGSGAYTGIGSDKELVRTPVSIYGDFSAADPEVTLPVKFRQSFWITSYDSTTGEWSGHGHREQVPFEPCIMSDPDPVYVYYQFAYNPINATIVVDEFDAPYTASDVATAKINGIEASIISVSPDGLKLEFPIAAFLEDYGAPLDTTDAMFGVTGTFADGETWVSAGWMMLIGKSSASGGKRWIVPQDEVLLHGDVDLSGFIDIDDIVELISFIFSGGIVPGPLLIGDCDCSHSVDIDDVVYLINYTFSSGPFPCHD